VFQKAAYFTVDDTLLNLNKFAKLFHHWKKSTTLMQCFS